MIFTFCASNSPLQGDREGEGGVREQHMIWSASTGTLKWGIPFLNHRKQLSSTTKALLLKGAKKATKKSKLTVVRFVLAVLGSESVCKNSVCRRQRNEKEIMVFNLILRQEIQQELFLKKRKKIMARLLLIYF